MSIFISSRLIKAVRFLPLAILLFSGFCSNLEAQVLINEIQTSNIHTTVDQFGEYEDWIELYNNGASAVNLNGYGLSDDISKPYLFQFADMNIPAKSSLLVFASDSNISDIKSHWETAINSNSTWNYRANTNTPPDTNWRNLSFNGTWSAGTGGIGFGDSDDGTIVSTCVSIYSSKTFSISDTSKIQAAILNVDYDDAFVAYLNGVEIARMNIGTRGIRPAWNDVALVAHEATMYQGGNPDSFYIDRNILMSLLTNGTNVLAVEVHNQNSTNNDITCRPWLSFLVNDDVSYFGSVPSFFKIPTNIFLHAGFKLSRSGETVYLSNAAGVIIDQKNSDVLEPDNSYGRNPDGSSNWCLFGNPTPGASNNNSSCANSYATTPVFSLSAGFYNVAQTLSLASSFQGGQIRYTIDGSEVTNTSALYTSSIRIDTTITIRAAVFAANSLPSAAVTNTYFISVASSLPVFSLTTDPVNLWDYNTGIFVKGPNAGTSNPYWGANFWQDWEKPITLEYYDRSKNRAFRFNSGMKITGGWSRSAPQKSMEIMLGDRYGQSKLNYALEESVKPWIDKWDDFILHTTGNDRNLCKMRDPLMNRLLKGTNNDYLAYEPCLVFINGQNWGVYYIRENDDHHWIESNYGYKKDEVDLLKESYFYPGIEVKKGTDSAFFEMYEYAMNTSSSDPAFYNTMSSFMDLNNMADYFIAETYYPNDDWMGGTNNNLKLWRPRKDGGKFRYLIYDLDFGLGYSGTVTNNMLSVARNASPHNYNSDLFKVLTNNATYKRYFINRYADLMNTIFLPSNIESMINLYRDSLKNDMHFQWKAWGGDSTTWISKISAMVTFANQRPANARNFVQSEFGLAGQVILTLQAQPAGAGRIEISTITPASLPWNGVYFNGNPVTITAIPNPGFTFDHWKSNVAINQNNYNQSTTVNFTANDIITCYFTGSAASVDIAFSEINYNSANTADAGDWIELKNNSSYTLNLSGWKFRDENDQHVYALPTGSTISGGGYLVLSSDLNKFKSKFPSVQNVIGDFGFDFSNGGENLRISNQKDSLIKSVYYQDQIPWPLAADGQGYTLERKNLLLNANDGNSWFAGCLGGSPGGPFVGPTVNISTSGALSICQGDSVSLQASSTSTATFQWRKNSININQANASDYSVLSSGTYQVQVTDQGCSALSDSIQIMILPIEQVLSVSSGQRCDSGTVQLNATGTSTLKWFDSVSGGMEVGSGNSFNTPVLSNSKNYFVSATGTCVGPRHELIATILPIAAAPLTQDAERCGPGDISLIASDTAAIRWYASPVGGTLLSNGAQLNISSLQQTEVFYAEAGSVCASNRVAAFATVLPITPAPLIADENSCGPDAFVLSVIDSNTIRWYDSSSGANLLFTGNTYTTPVISQTTSFFVQAGDICPSVKTEVKAIINPTSADPVAADVHRCGGGSLNLNAASTDIVRWYDAINGNLISSSNLFNTPAINQNTTYYIQAGSLCPSAWISVQAIIDPVTPDPTVSDGENCGPGFVTLNASASGLVSWYDAAGGNLLGTGNTFTSPLISTDKIYYAQAGQTCPSAFVAVSAIIHNLPEPELGNDTIIASGTQLVLDPGQGFNSYLWSDGSTSNILNVQSGGMYSVVVTDMNSCSAVDSIMVLVSTGIFSQRGNTEFRLFPNPASRNCTVELPQLNSEGKMFISEISGRVLKEFDIQKNDLQIRINLSDMASGVYQVRLISDGWLATKTLIIQ